MCVDRLNIKTVILILLILVLSGCGVLGFSKQDPQYYYDAALTMPDPAQMEQGLTVVYFRKLNVRHVDQMPMGKNILKFGASGKPIVYIDHDFGTDDVFDSRSNIKIGVYMYGWLRLDKTGTYRFRAVSNDGVRIYIGNQVVANDPDVHSSRMSKPVAFELQRAGWHPLFVQYFQRKNTALLRFQWQIPGSEEFEPIPESAYGHTPDQNPFYKQNEN